MSFLNTSHVTEVYIILASYSEESYKIAAAMSGFVHASIQACIDKLHWNAEMWFGFRGRWSSYSH